LNPQQLPPRLFVLQQLLQKMAQLLHLHPSYQRRQLLQALLLLRCCRLHLVLALAWGRLLS
jgi:hypothetical protein